MSSLIVLLPLEPIGASTELGYALTSEGRTLEGHGSAVAALLPRPKGAGAEVIAIVPAQVLSWHRVDLPKGAGMGSPRLRAALEGMLEEELLDDPDRLHFAVQPLAQAGHSAWVAACDRAWLRAALGAMESAQRPVSRIVPEFAPGEPQALHVVGDPEQAQLVLTNEQGVLVLPLAATSLPLLPHLPDDALIFAEPAVAAMGEQVLQQKVQLQQQPQRWIQATRSGWDLAQFEFASSGRARALRKAAGHWAELLRAPQWRAARWGAALLVLANLVGLNAWAWRERAALDAKRQAVQRTLTEAFPNVKVVVDAPVQMQRELATLRQMTGVASARDLEAMLAALGAALPPGRAPSGLQYTGSELRARGLGLSPDELRAVSSALKARGYSASAQGDALLIAAEDVR